MRTVQQMQTSPDNDVSQLEHLLCHIYVTVLVAFTSTVFCSQYSRNLTLVLQYTVYLKCKKVENKTFVHQNIIVYVPFFKSNSPSRNQNNNSLTTHFLPRHPMKTNHFMEIFKFTDIMINEG